MNRNQAISDCLARLSKLQHELDRAVTESEIKPLLYQIAIEAFSALVLIEDGKEKR